MGISVINSRLNIVLNFVICEQGFILYAEQSIESNNKGIRKETYANSPIRGSRRYNYTRKAAGMAGPDMLHRSDTSDSNTRLYLQ